MPEPPALALGHADSTWGLLTRSSPQQAFLLREGSLPALSVLVPALSAGWPCIGLGDRDRGRSSWAVEAQGASRRTLSGWWKAA